MASRVRTTITMLVLIGILCAGAWYGWTGLTAGRDVEAEPEAAPTTQCPRPKPVLVRSVDTMVSVYNAGAPAGTGGDVMDRLNHRGFRRGELDVAPKGLSRRRTVILTSNPDAPEVRLVARQFRSPRIEKHANPPGPGVNVLVGAAFPGWRNPVREMRVRPRPDC